MKPWTIGFLLVAQLCASALDKDGCGKNVSEVPALGVFRNLGAYSVSVLPNSRAPIILTYDSTTHWQAETPSGSWKRTKITMPASGELISAPPSIKFVADDPMADAELRAASPVNAHLYFSAKLISERTSFAMFAVVKGNKEAGYITLYPNGLYRSSDGETWSMVNRSIKNRAAVRVSPLDSAVMVAQDSFGIVISKDHGETWVSVAQSEAMAQPSRSPSIQKAVEDARKRTLWPLPLDFYLKDVAFHPSQKDTFVLVTSTGAFITKDGGSTWKLLDVGQHRFDELSSAAFWPKSPFDLLVAGKAGLWRATEDGCNFVSVPLPKIP